jgi:phosphoribosylformylglycinamidine synthase
MPHPERFVHPTHHPRWTRQKPEHPDGLTVFNNAVNYFR